MTIVTKTTIRRLLACVKEFDYNTYYYSYNTIYYTRVYLLCSNTAGVLYYIDSRVNRRSFDSGGRG